MSNNLDDEIVIGINRPKTPNKNSKKKNKKTKKEDHKKTENNKKVAKNATSKNNKDKQSKSKKGLKIFIIIFLIIITMFIIMNINICQIKNVELIGNESLTKEQIEGIVNFEQYNNLFALNTLKVKDDLEKNAYIEDVKVSRIFPNTVKLTIKERTPRFMLQVADSYVYINSQGYMLEVSVEKLNVPIILGFKTDLSNVEAGNRLEVDDLKELQTIIKIVQTAKSNEIADMITKIDVSNNRNYTLILEGEQKTVYLGDCSDLNTKMLYLNGILNQTKNLAGEIFLNMDLNTDDAYFREKT
ncbi:MAG: FtsQ-type POTRA domain-containing protein [Clostridia bacterium]|nr:FtsQ-type POTRA domain-containing protein [Clostridia bacterium]